VKLDHEVRQALALAVAKPGSRSLLIGPDNLANGWADIAEAAGHDRCHAVDVRPEVLALDLDHHPAAVVEDEAAQAVPGGESMHERPESDALDYPCDPKAAPLDRPWRR
jgi:hypothetical protein